MTHLSGLVTLVGETNGQQNQSSLDKYIMHADEVRTILGYCYQHADRPNPVQDLLDKGLVSADFAGDTCALVKQGSESKQFQNAEIAHAASDAYHECLQAGIVRDCSGIIVEYCANPVYARYIDNCPP
jgi:hypothetical protein